ncbi:NAD(P)-dependent oxidoreductase [Stackebrandtia endophytica]|nr:NAD(P)H-binding protein [Stackebrandtia endophytica]
MTETPLTLLILGASGGTGKLLVEQALAAGHHVVAAVRNPAKIDTRHERLRVHRADVADPDDLRPLVAEADAVLSALGTVDRPICEPAIRAVLAAATSPVRVVAVSAQPVNRDDSEEGIMKKRVILPLVRRIYRRQYADLAGMEAVLRDSDACWTVLRPPYLTDKPSTGGYRLRVEGNPISGNSLPRADLARAMLDLVADETTHRKAIGIAT